MRPQAHDIRAQRDQDDRAHQSHAEPPARAGGIEALPEHRQHDDGREHWVTNIGPVHFEIKATQQADGSPTPDAVVSDGGGHSNIELSFRVEDAQRTWDAAIAAGGSAHQPLVTYRWGVFGVVLDPDGNRLGIYAACPPPSGASADEEEDA